MSKKKNAVVKLADGLPEACYACMPGKDSVVYLKRGEMGFTSTNQFGGEANATMLNALLGVSKAQMQAMLAGSMFGWGVKAADPRHYDKEGDLVIG